jgi:integron integrase
MSQLSAFENFLTQRRIVPSKNVSFYGRWVLQCYSFITKPIEDSLSDEDVGRFLSFLEKSCKEWQISQADEAIRLYRYYQTSGRQQPIKSSNSLDEQWKCAADEMVRMLRLKQRALRTEEAYMQWLRSFYGHVKGTAPEDIDSGHAKSFLSHLSVDRRVASSTQNQALNALLFFYRHVLGKDLGDLSSVVRARKKRQIPTVLTHNEVFRLFGHMSGIPKLMAQLTYGCGLRLMECIRLRIQNLDFEQHTLTVKSGKGDKDRLTVLPKGLIQPLKTHLKEIRGLYDQDRENDISGVYLPNALERKYPNAGKEWIWQWVFPSRSLSVDPKSKIIRRHHVNKSYLSRHIKQASTKAGLTKRVTVHTLRHSFATHLVENGYDIRTVQELLGHASVQTTMIYTHVAKTNRLGVISPFDQ